MNGLKFGFIFSMLADFADIYEFEDATWYASGCGYARQSSTLARTPTGIAHFGRFHATLSGISWSLPRTTKRRFSRPPTNKKAPGHVPRGFVCRM